MRHVRDSEANAQPCILSSALAPPTKKGRDDGSLVLDAAVVGVGHEVSGSNEVRAPPFGFVRVGRGIGRVKTGTAGIELEDLRCRPTADRSVDTEFFPALSGGAVMQGDVDGFGNDRFSRGGKRKGREGDEQELTQGFHAAPM